MRHRADTAEGVNELKMIKDGERIYWFRKSPKLKREMTIYRDVLTPEQQQRLDQIEQELLEMAYEADEESITKTVLKSAEREEPQSGVQ